MSTRAYIHVVSSFYVNSFNFCCEN